MWGQGRKRWKTVGESEVRGIRMSKSGKERRPKGERVEEEEWETQWKKERE